MGIIDSLSAGFRFAGRRLELLLVPVLLDALLWLAPRLSIEPLLTGLSTFYREMGSVPGMPDDLVNMSSQVALMLAELGRTSNLMDMLVSHTLFRVPSLLAGSSNLQPGATSVEISSPGLALGFVLALGLLGLLVGAVYMNALARTLVRDEEEESPAPAEFVGMVLRHWRLALIFIVGMATVLVLIYIPATIGITLMSLISLALASIAALLLSGLTVGLFFYLYFVTVGLVLDNLSLKAAVQRSVVLVRYNFWSALGFILFTTLISTGIGLILHRLAVTGTLGTVLAIVGNAYIGTGLAVALLIYYRARVVRMAEQAHGGV